MGHLLSVSSRVAFAGLLIIGGPFVEENLAALESGRSSAEAEMTVSGMPWQH